VPTTIDEEFFMTSPFNTNDDPQEPEEVVINESNNQTTRGLSGNLADIQDGINLFNKKFSEGISHLIERGYITDTPGDIASFLWKYKESLNKNQLGDLLGGKNDSDIQIISSFIKNFNFISLSIDQAIRIYIQEFMLPGEAQKISRIMDVFALEYVNQNPNSYIPDQDCAFVLSFAIIMLNTDAHNPAIAKENKMKKEEFLKNLKGTWLDGGDPPQDIMGNIYDNIVEDEIIIMKEGDPDKRGWMKMQAGNLREGQKFFLLKGNDLHWYKEITLDGNSVPLRGKLSLNDHITVLPSVEQDSFKIYLYSTKQNVPITLTLFDKNKTVEHKSIKISLTCANALAKDQWITVLRKNILVSINPQLGSLISSPRRTTSDEIKRKSNEETEKHRPMSEKIKKRNPLKSISQKLNLTKSSRLSHY